MKQLFLSFSLITLALITACNPNDNTVDVSASQEITFRANIATRATEQQFETGDAIGVYASYLGTGNIGDYAQNVKYEFSGNYFKTNNQLRYPESGDDLLFYAIYPYSYNSYYVPEFSFAVNTDQRNHSNYTTSDLMTASAIGYKNQTVDLIFNHRLAKIVINIVSGNVPAGEQTLTFKNVKYIADANLNNNTYYAATTATANVTAASNGTNSFKAILPPQSIAQNSSFVEINIGGTIYEWVIDRNLVFNSGVEYVYNLTLNEENDIEFAAQINPWGEPEEIESVIPEEYIDIIENYMPIHTGNTPPNIEGTYLISPALLLTDNIEGGYEDGYRFADDYIMFHDQSADNTISMKSTQNLGDLSVGSGLFISGTGKNFTIYFNEYSTQDDGSWLTKASIISGTLENGCLKDYTKAFIILDDYDVDGKYMDAGQYRIVYDGDYSSEQTEWPLDTRSTKLTKRVSVDRNK